MTAVDITLLSLLGILLILVFVLPTVAEECSFLPKKIQDFFLNLADKTAIIFFICIGIVVIVIPFAIFLLLAS